MILIYDGTFECFLTLIYDVYYKKYNPKKILKRKPCELILEDIITIEYDEEKYKKVFQSIKNSFSKKNFQRIFNIFMCDSVDFELILLAYIKIGFKNQKELENINHNAIFEIMNLEKEYFRLSHKMSGFIRFIELNDGVLYSKIDTKFNILYYLGEHFSKRFNNQNFIIHDIKREIAYIKNSQISKIQTISSYDDPILSKDEEKFAKLWKEFFNSVAIKQRKNDKLQKQLVPLVYREFMNEFD